MVFDVHGRGLPSETSIRMGEAVTTDNLEARALPCPSKFSTGSPLTTPDPIDFDIAPSVEGEH